MDFLCTNDVLPPKSPTLYGDMHSVIRIIGDRVVNNHAMRASHEE